MKLLLSLLVVCWCLSSLQAQTLRAAKECIDQAGAQMEQGNIDRAQSDIDRCIQLYPGSSLAYFFRGQLQLLRTNFNGALADFNKVIELTPTAPGVEVVYNNRATIRIAQGDTEGALADVNKAISLNPSYPNAYQQRGMLQEMSGNLDLAIADFSKAISLGPGFPGPYNGRGNIRSDRESDGALSDYSKAIALNQNFTPAYVGRAIIYYQKGELDAALKEYDKVVELAPDHPQAHFDRGVILTLKGQLAESVKALKRGIAIAPDAFDGKPSKSVVTPASQLNGFIQSNPRNARGYEARGLVRWLQGHAATAREDFLRAEAIDPKLKAEIDNIAEVRAP